MRMRPRWLLLAAFLPPLALSGLIRKAGVTDLPLAKLLNTWLLGLCFENDDSLGPHRQLQDCVR